MARGFLDFDTLTAGAWTPGGSGYAVRTPGGTTTIVSSAIESVTRKRLHHTVTDSTHASILTERSHGTVAGAVQSLTLVTIASGNVATRAGVCFPRGAATPYEAVVVALAQQSNAIEIFVVGSNGLFLGSTSLAGLNLGFVQGQRWWVRAEWDATTNTIRGRAWRLGSSEPGTWNVSATWSTWAPEGRAGLWSSRQSAVSAFDLHGWATAGESAPSAPLPSSVDLAGTAALVTGGAGALTVEAAAVVELAGTAVLATGGAGALTVDPALSIDVQRTGPAEATVDYGTVEGAVRYVVQRRPSGRAQEWDPADRPHVDTAAADGDEYRVGAAFDDDPPSGVTCHLTYIDDNEVEISWEGTGGLADGIVIERDHPLYGVGEVYNGADTPPVPDISFEVLVGALYRVGAIYGSDPPAWSAWVEYGAPDTLIAEPAVWSAWAPLPAWSGGDVDLAGTATLTSGGSGVLVRDVAAGGTASLVSGAAAAATVDRAFAGTCALTTGGSGDLTVTGLSEVTFSGTCTLTSGAAGTLARTAGLAGAAGLTTAGTATLVRDVTVAGAAALVTGGSGALTVAGVRLPDDDTILLVTGPTVRPPIAVVAPAQRWTAVLAARWEAAEPAVRAPVAAGQVAVRDAATVGAPADRWQAAGPVDRWEVGEPVVDRPV